MNLMRSLPEGPAIAGDALDTRQRLGAKCDVWPSGPGGGAIGPGSGVSEARCLPLIAIYDCPAIRALEVRSRKSK